MIIGIDEAGRGPCAGPLVAAAVALAGPLGGLADSKTLTAPKRRDMAEIIKRQAVAIGIGWVSAQAIDKHGLSWAQTKAMGQALSQIELVASDIIVDGKINYLAKIAKTRAVIGADRQFPAVMAASIIAKTARDSFMVALSQLYPSYDLDKHKGYCTRAHLQLISQQGAIKAVHRFSYKPIQQISPSL